MAKTTSKQVGTNSEAKYDRLDVEARIYKPQPEKTNTGKAPRVPLQASRPGERRI